MLSKCLVACNVYLSAGLPRYAPLLVQLLEDAQKQCHGQNAIIVHAFSDTSYDRSSFHIAGSPLAVASVASNLACQAIEVLSKHKKTNKGEDIPSSSELEHPTVGLVDHISVLPLADHNRHPSMTLTEWTKQHETPKNFIQNKKDDQDDDLPVKCLPSGWVARMIGENLKQSSSVHVLYYGHAHVNQKSLAKVRREETAFFKLSSSINKQNSNTNKLPKSQCTIGAPDEFVENFNIRLSNKISKSKAQSLTRWVREKDGGLPFVEALTLPYSNNRYEVACNLVNPIVTNTNDVQERVRQYLEVEPFLETCYRVGTTEEQCLNALEETQTDVEKEKYNRRVQEQLKGYLFADTTIN